MEAFADFCELQAEEIGVLMQIINMGYINQRGPVEENINHLAKCCCIRPSKCQRIVDRLVHKSRIKIEDIDGKRYWVQKRTANEVKNIQEWKENESKRNRNCVVSRHEKERKQRLSVTGRSIINNKLLFNNNPPTPLQDGGLSQFGAEAVERILGKAEAGKDFSGNGFTGTVITFSADEKEDLLWRYASNEQKLDDWLKGRDAWYTAQPYHIQKNWRNSTIKALVSGKVRL